MSGFFSRPAQPPRWVRDAALGRGERVLASAEALDGTWLVGSRDSLSVVLRGERYAEEGMDSSAATSVTRIPWEQVHRADWDQETSMLRIERVQEYGTPVEAWTLELEDPRAFLSLLRERVSASVVVQTRVEVGRKKGLTVIGRRAPAGDGDVTWAYQFDPGVDPDDPAVMAAAERALAEAQESLGY